MNSCNLPYGTRILAALAFLLLALAAPAAAQVQSGSGGGVAQYGTVTANDCAVWRAAWLIQDGSCAALGGTNIWTGLNTFTLAGVVIGAPTGGNEGAGTLNAQNGVYINGVNLSTTYAPLASPTFTGTVTVGTSGTAGSVALGNATSGTVTLNTVTGALGSVTASLPANSGTLAEINLAQTWSAVQTFPAGDLVLGTAVNGDVATFDANHAVQDSGVLLSSKAPLVSPSFTTPTLGVATATSINKVTITQPATGSTLTIPDGVTLNAGAGGTLGSLAFLSSINNGNWSGTGLALTNLAAQAANTVDANATSGSATPTAFAMPSCSASTNGLIWTTSTGFGCNSSINAATLGGATFAAPGAIGGGTAAAGNFTTLGTTGALTYGGVTLNNTVTGTGNMVLATSPTITSPTITAISSGIAAMTLNGSVNQAVNICTGTCTGTITLGAASTTLVTSPAPFTDSNATVTLSGLTTGTNADFLCRTSGGVVLIQTSACTISSMRFKDLHGLYEGDALAMLSRLNVWNFTIKGTAQDRKDRNSAHLQTGLLAEDVAKFAPNCAIYEQDMRTPKSYRQECVIALLVAGEQQMQGEIQRLPAYVISNEINELRFAVGLLILWNVWLSRRVLRRRR